MLARHGDAGSRPRRRHGGLMMRRMLLGVTVIGLALGGGSTPVSTQGSRSASSSPARARATAPTSAGWPAPTRTARRWRRRPARAAGTWRAYLSASAAGGQAAVNAKDRIGSGPWYNAKGVLIAQNVADLHNEATTKVGKENSLTEKGTVNNGRGDTPNQHDILTGSNIDGTLATRRRRHHLRQLDQQQGRRQRAGRPPRPPGRRRQPQLVELGPPVEGLQPGEPRRHRRQRLLLLLRGEVRRYS